MSGKSFVVFEDQAGLASVGDGLHFDWVKPVFEPTQPPFSRPSNWEMFEGSVLAVTFSTGSTHTVLGSAVMVAPGIALCVNHVVDEFLSKLAAGTVVAMFVGISSHGADGWKPTHVTRVERTDLRE